MPGTVLSVLHLLPYSFIVQSTHYILLDCKFLEDRSILVN